jgi:RNA processing factor Prp31
MRWLLSLSLLCTSFACSPEPAEKKEVKREVHAQAAVETKAAAAPEAKEEVPEGGQTFREGMAALCESYEKAPKSDDPAESQKLLHAWLGEHVTNEKVREVFTLVGEMPPSQRGGMLRAAAAKVGITECALAGPDPLAAPKETL